MPVKRKIRDNKSEEKTNIGILLPKTLWNRFKIHCINSDQKPGNLLGQMIEEYLDRKEKAKR